MPVGRGGGINSVGVRVPSTTPAHGHFVLSPDQDGCKNSEFPVVHKT